MPARRSACQPSRSDALAGAKRRLTRSAGLALRTAALVLALAAPVLALPTAAGIGQSTTIEAPKIGKTGMGLVLLVSLQRG